MFQSSIIHFVYILSFPLINKGADTLCGQSILLPIPYQVFKLKLVLNKSLLLPILLLIPKQFQNKLNEVPLPNPTIDEP